MVAVEPACADSEDGGDCGTVNCHGRSVWSTDERSYLGDWIVNSK